MTGAADRNDTAKRKAAVISFLENASQLIVDSYNQRDFSPTSAAWSVCSDTFISETRTPTGQFIHRDLKGHLDNLRQLAAAHPESSNHLAGFNIELSLEKGTATCYGILEFSGLTAMPTQSIGMLEWNRIDGKWWCTKHVGLQGMAGEGMAGGSLHGLGGFGTPG